MNLTLIERGAELILRGLEVDLTNRNFETTPARYAKVLQEMFQPKETGWPVFEEDYTDNVIMSGHEFYTMCPHHMLPVKVTAYVGYIPNGQVIGASKLVRLLHEVNRKPETQEKLTQLALSGIKDYTKGTSKGEAVLMVGEHGCMRIRGVRSAAKMITYKFNGEYNDPEMQRRFFALVGVK